MQPRRAFVTVIDACGAGELPDSADYGDAGANTLGHTAEAVHGLVLPTFERLGLGCILPLEGCPCSPEPVLHGRLRPLGPGKETISGHWELMGVVTPVALKTYPDGFPPEVIADLERVSGRKVICNRPYSGTAVIDDYGEQHMQTGDLIVYTSADSVLQIAAHEEIIPRAELYEICAQARKIMTGEHTVGRVIARPFVGQPGSFERTTGRRDLAVKPPTTSYLQHIQAAGFKVHSVGKVGQVFAEVGIDDEFPGATNAIAIESIGQLIDTLDSGLVFANLVETDQVYGHRRDPAGYHEALKVIDAAVADWCERLDPERDLLIITADHGCDPTAPGSDHTREHVPLLACFSGDGGRRHDGVFADVGASVFEWLTGEVASELPGSSFISSAVVANARAT